MNHEAILEKALLNEALELDPQERDAFLTFACRGDENLRKRLEKLLAASEDSAAPSEEPVAHLEKKEPGFDLIEGIGSMVGPYRLVDRIAEGGMGVVYTAEQEKPLRRRVALKVIKLGMDTKSVIARFDAERQALALMDHPNIAKVLDAGATETGRPYFVMELVHGMSITDYCDQNDLSTLRRLDLFIPVCRAIQHAHQKGIIHRDIKPSNVLVTLHDGVPTPKVIDFGIAKATEGRLTNQTLFTAFEQFIGTPAYMSPEQAGVSGLDVDTRSDIYSLGVLLYELLVGSSPFDTKEMMSRGIDAMRKTICEKEAVRPSTKLATLQGEELRSRAKHRSVESSKLVDLLRGDLDWIIMKCLEKDRSRRYETANGLAMDLKRHLNNEPVVARPPSGMYRFQKAWRRNKLVFTATAIVMATLIAGFAVSAWQTFAARKAQREEARQRREALKSRGEAQKAQFEEAQQRQRAENQAYSALMNEAQLAWEQNEIGRLRELLEETATNSARGFEWWYWQRQMHLEHNTLHGHTEVVRAVAFSPDGSRIATGSADYTAKVWDVASGRELFTLTGHKAAVTSVAFSHDGQRIVTGSADTTAIVWDGLTAKKRLTLKGHSRPVRSVAFSRDSQWIVTGSEDNTARVWEVASGRHRLTLGRHNAMVNSVTFSQDGRQIATGSDDGTAKLWDAASGNLSRTINAYANAVAFSPDDRRIIAGLWDGTAKVWEAATGQELFTLIGHRVGIMSVAFSPDGSRILTGSADRTAKVWDAASGTELLTLKGHAAMIWSVAFSPNGRWVATGSSDLTAKLWDTVDSASLVLKGHKSIVNTVAFSPRGDRILTGSDDRTAKVWESAGGRELVPLKGHTGGIRSAVFLPDDQRVVTASNDRTARVWDAATGTELLPLKGHTGTIFSVAVSGTGRRIVTGSADDTAKVWDAETGKALYSLDFRNWVHCVAISPDSQRIVAGLSDGTTRIWEMANGKEQSSSIRHGKDIRAVAFSADGQWIVTGSMDGTAKVWDAASGRERLLLKGHGDQILSVAFSPDSRRIVTAGADQTARVWDAASGKELLILRGGSSWIRGAAFSPSGLRIITSSGDHYTAKVWEAATPQEVVIWQQEEKTSTELVTALRRERAEAAENERLRRCQDPGVIKQWLVLAPIPFEGRSGATALDQEQIPREASLRPRAGDRMKLGGRELVWSELGTWDYLIDFNQLFGEKTEYSVAYAVCYIKSDTARTGLRMNVGSDDQAKVYLNGREIYRSETSRDYLPDQDVVSGLELKVGLNVLVFKVVNEVLNWFGSVRFTDSSSQPLEGIHTTLKPP